MADIDIPSLTNAGTLQADDELYLARDGTDDFKTTPADVLDYVEANYAQPVVFQIALSDETSDLATGTAVVTFRAPHAFTLTGVRASVTTAPTGTALQVDVNEGGTSVLSTKLQIDAGEKTSTTADTPAVISDSAIADDAELTIDIDQVGSTVAGTGLKVTLLGTRP